MLALALTPQQKPWQHCPLLESRNLLFWLDVQQREAVRQSRSSCAFISLPIVEGSYLKLLLIHWRLWSWLSNILQEANNSQVEFCNSSKFHAASLGYRIAPLPINRSGHGRDLASE
jgi:hypothetical protein